MDINQTLTEFTTTVKSFQEKLDATEKKLDGLDNEQLKKMAEAATSCLETVQAEQQKMTALTESVKHMESHLNTLSNAARTSGGEKNYDAYGDSLARFLRKNIPIPAELSEELCNDLAVKSFKGADPDWMKNEIKAMSVGNNPDGGYLIRPQWSGKIITRIFETSPMRNLADIQNTATDSLSFIIDDNTGISGGWVSEQQARNETGTPQIGTATITAYEQYANPRVTQKILDDAAFDIEAWLANKTTDIFTRTENTAFVNGTGVGQPRGFMTYAAWITNGIYQRNALEQIHSLNASLITADGMKALQNSLKEFYQPSASFLMKRDTFTAIMQLKDGMGRYLLDTNSFKVGDNKVLLGKAVTFADDMPVVAASALPIAYGDWSLGYTIVDRFGIRVIRDQLTNKPNTLFYTTKRVGGDVTNFEAIKLLLIAA